MKSPTLHIRRLFSTIPFLLSLALVPTGTSFWLSIQTHNWSWFVRSTSFLMIAGVLMMTRKLIRLGFRGIVNEVLIKNGGSFEPLKPFGHTDSREQQLDRVALEWGIVFAVVGLFLWTYGDFLNM